MSHIHIPDGVMGELWWLLVLSYILLSVLLVIIFKRIKREDVGKRIPVVGIMSAIMLIAMSVPLGFIPFHLNLASLCGIMVGPNLGFIAVFVVNLLLSFMGHGGITVVGLNSLIVGLEMFLSVTIYSRLVKEGREGISSSISTFLALIVSTVVTFVIMIFIIGEDPREMLTQSTSFIILYIILAVGIVLESIATGLIVSFLAKVKPDLVEPVDKY